MFIFQGEFSVHTEYLVLFMIIWPQMGGVLLISLPGFCLSHNLMPAFSLPAVPGVINTLLVFAPEVWFQCFECHVWLP